MAGNRLLTATLVLGALLALTVWQWQARESEDARPGDTAAAKLPKPSKDAPDALEISAPGKPAIKLVKQDKTWALTAPLAARADADAVDSALAKLAELEAIGIAATKQENHAKLEVDDAQAVHVVAKQGDKVLADLFLGAYRSGNTMVREKGSVNVASVKGSIKFAFEKELKEWRDRTIAQTDVDKLTEATFQNAAGTFRFVREGSEWKQAAGDKPLANLDATKVASVITSVARLHATDFAGEGVTADAAGVGQTPVGVVTLVSSEADAAPIVLRVGGKQGDEYYVARDGQEPIYVVSQFSGERLLAGPDKLTKDEPEQAASGKPPAKPAAQRAPTAAAP